MIRRGRIADNPANRDGVCGPGMDRALRALQAAEGIVVDGVGGPQTWTALVT
jgi:peptidoglycan hydrolase-like protein with peptidoglycan-binding domain